MARYEHLPIFRDAYDLTVHIEKIVRNFSRYHKYTLGSDLRKRSRIILDKIVQANSDRENRQARLLELRQELESFKVITRLCHDSLAFPNTRSYLHVAKRITNLAKQNEGWIRQTSSKEKITHKNRINRKEKKEPTRAKKRKTRGASDKQKRKQTQLLLDI